MKKSQAIKLLGGTAAVAARKLKVSRQAVSQWPKTLTPNLVEKVVAAVLEHAEKLKAAGLKADA